MTASAELPDYSCPGCNTESEMIMSPEQAFCRALDCRVIHFNPSMADGGLADGSAIDLGWLRNEPKLPDGYQPGCSHQQCACWRPGVVCDEYMGEDVDLFCPRCGWARGLHTKRPSERVTVHVEQPDGTWQCLGTITPDDTPGSITNNTPDGGRQVFVFGWYDNQGPCVWRSLGGADYHPDGASSIRVIESSGLDSVADLRSGPARFKFTGRNGVTNTIRFTYFPATATLTPAQRKAVKPVGPVVQPGSQQQTAESKPPDQR